MDIPPFQAGYAGLAAWYLVVDQIPALFFASLGLLDFLFLLGFAWILVGRWSRLHRVIDRLVTAPPLSSSTSDADFAQRIRRLTWSARSHWG